MAALHPMYTPHAFREDDPAALEALIRDHPFATLITSGDRVEVTHGPLLLDATRGPHGTLVGHIARANPHRKALEAGAETLAIFHGPHAYVSPSWYEASPAVPTWNYAVVHAHGRPRMIEDPVIFRALLDQLVDTFEAGLPEPWSMEGLPEEWVERLMTGIVGFEIEITRLEGKFKLSQNRSSADQQGVIANLSAQDHPASQAVARLQDSRLPKSSDR